MAANKSTGERSISYKVRRSGNSDIVTIPSNVKEFLNITEGDSIVFVADGDSIRLEKETPVLDVDQIIYNVMNQYDTLLSKLVEL